LLATSKDRFFDSNGVRIRYVDQGSGEPIVLVPGFTATIEMNWIDTGALGELSKNHRVIAFDCRGHGKSGKPHDPNQYGRQMAMDAFRLMDHLHISKAHIVGYSMGGSLVAQLLAIDPTRFITATLGGFAPTLQPPPAQNPREAWAAEIERGDFRLLALAIAAPGRPKPTEEQLNQWSADRRVGNDVLALAAVLRAPPGPALDKIGAAALRIPVLGVAGTDDRALDGLKAVKPAIPQLEIVAILGADHMETFSRPEFVRQLVKFINAHHAVGQ
jgi:pimeloyl-ACP methyl ester carboxylesterase